MKVLCVGIVMLLAGLPAFGWGFYAHRQINYYAVFLLPPEMLGYYKKNIRYISEHAVDPDKRRYAVKEEGARHYIDLDRYGEYPFTNLPRTWKEAVARYSEDTLQAHGIVPWWIQTMLARLTGAFVQKDCIRIRQLSAEIGHYIADAHVPLHTSSNHNGQFSGQHGIHGFWESRIPELLAPEGWDFLIGKAAYIQSPLTFMWDRILESAAACDSVLLFEQKLNNSFRSDRKYSFEPRAGMIVKQYSKQYTIQYDRMLNYMVERRMRASIFAVASFWYTAWVNAGQPLLDTCLPDSELLGNTVRDSTDTSTDHR